MNYNYYILFSSSATVAFFVPLRKIMCLQYQRFLTLMIRMMTSEFLSISYSMINYGNYFVLLHHECLVLFWTQTQQHTEINVGSMSIDWLVHSSLILILLLTTANMTVNNRSTPTNLSLNNAAFNWNLNA